MEYISRNEQIEKIQKISHSIDILIQDIDIINDIYDLDFDITRSLDKLREGLENGSLDSKITSFKTQEEEDYFNTLYTKEAEILTGDDLIELQYGLRSFPSTITDSYLSARGE